MQASLFPASIFKTLDSNCNNFLWGDSNERKRTHLVGKDQTFVPKNRGGLGIRAQKQMNILPIWPSVDGRCLRLPPSSARRIALDQSTFMRITSLNLRMGLTFGRT